MLSLSLFLVTAFAFMYSMHVCVVPVEANSGLQTCGTGVKDGRDLETKPRYLQRHQVLTLKC